MILFKNGLISTIDSISWAKTFTYSKMPGDTLMIPTRTVRIIRASGTNEKINPNEQEDALSQRLFASKLEQVR